MINNITDWLVLSGPVPDWTAPAGAIMVVIGAASLVWLARTGNTE